MLAEFEEKEFEGALNAQLALGGPLWSPGQVLEQIVGFDVALFVEDVSFWAAMGFGSPATGSLVQSSWWSRWPRGGVFRRRNPPQFRLNVFLQYKRPTRLTRRGGEWKDWKTRYFRFEIKSRQQAALDACARSLGSGGLVAYASPVFAEREEFFTHVEKGTLVANTHFAPATALNKHTQYTYVSARGAGKAHSAPIEVHPISFGVPPIEPPDSGGGSGGPTPESILAAAKKAARAAIDHDPKVVGGKDLFDRAVRRAQDLVQLGPFGDVPARSVAIDPFLIASIFGHMSGLGWNVSP